MLTWITINLHHSLIAILLQYDNELLLWYNSKNMCNQAGDFTMVYILFLCALNNSKLLATYKKWSSREGING